MKSIDARKKHAVTLTFLLDEEVSPQVLAQLIAEACGGGVLKKGEGIRVDHAKIACVVTRPSRGWQWQRSSEDPKHLKFKRNTCK